MRLFNVPTAAIALSIVASICTIHSSADGLRAAAAKIDITPPRPAYLAGYSIARKSEAVHDHLSARCVVLDDGTTRIALVSCDLIGVPRFNTLLIRKQISRVPQSQVIIGGTHTHSGPDTLGMWGPTLTVSGVDKPWLEDTCTKIARMVDATADAIKPVTLRLAETSGLKRISKNIRLPQILDTHLSVLQLQDEQTKKPLVTLVNYACHPEILNNRQMTADFPHWLYEAVEAAGGGECIYFNGAQGGMVTADFDESLAPRGANWVEAERIGKQLGAAALKVIADAPLVTAPTLSFARQVFSVPLANRRYRALINMKVFSGTLLPDGSVETEASWFKIGPAEFVTIPGEALPNVGIFLRAHMQGSPRFQLGLTNDFLGYILAPEDFGVDLYGYESGQSVGPEIEPILVKNLLQMIDAKR